MRRPASSIAVVCQRLGSLDRKLSAEAEGPVAEPRSRGPSERGPVRMGVLAAKLKREADAEIARIPRWQEGRWEPKQPALVPRERPANERWRPQSRRRHPRVSTTQRAQDGSRPEPTGAYTA